MIARLIKTLVFCLLTRVASSQSVAPPGAWLQDKVKWQRAPKDINPKLRSGRAAVIYFWPNQSVSVLYATVTRVPKEYEVICNGCGQVVYCGTWELAEKSVKIKYQFVSRTVEVIGEQLPGPSKYGDAKIKGDSLVFLGHSFHRAPDLDANVLEFVSPRCRR